MSFFVGQEVVCIDAKECPGCAPFDADECLVNGTIYKVRRSFFNDEEINILWLDQVARNQNSIAQWNDPNLGYGAFRFRPVIKCKTDIGFAILQKICDGVTDKKKVDA